MSEPIQDTPATTPENNTVLPAVTTPAVNSPQSIISETPVSIEPVDIDKDITGHNAATPKAKRFKKDKLASDAVTTAPPVVNDAAQETKDKPKALIITIKCATQEEYDHIKAVAEARVQNGKSESVNHALRQAFDFAMNFRRPRFIGIWKEDFLHYNRGNIPAVPFKKGLYNN